MKQIFVGSSSHGDAERHSRVLCDHISKMDPSHVKAVYWRDAFPLSVLTYDALERMLKVCSGAVLVATPEVDGQPNENVMLEFGLVAGRMGITNVVLCKHAEAKVPTDLLSLTYIELRPGTDGNELSDSARDLLRNWALSLPETMEGVPCTRIVHGYSGRWSVFLKFQRWRAIPMEGKSFATLEGRMDLYIPPDGKRGFGLSTGTVLVHRVQNCSDGEASDANYAVCAQVSDVECLPSGAMRLRTHTLSRQRLDANGHQWHDEGLSDEEIGPWSFNWHMIPDPENRRFTVTLETDAMDWTKGEGELRQETASF